MSFIRRQWLAIVILAALGTSFVVGQQEARTDTAQVRTKAIEVCTANSQSAAHVVAFKYAVAADAQQRGAAKVAQQYRRLANGGLAVIPLPPGAEQQRKDLAIVVQRGERFVLTDAAKTLMREGCVESYRP